MTDRTHYLLPENDPREAPIRAVFQKLEDVYKAWCQFQDAHGGDNIFADLSVRGLAFNKGSPPAGWRQRKKDPSSVWYPPKSIAAGKEMAALPRKPTSSEFVPVLGVDSVLEPGGPSGMRLCHPHVEVIGERLVIGLTRQMEIPEGLVELKNSEYYAMLEEQESAA